MMLPPSMMPPHVMSQYTQYGMMHHMPPMPPFLGAGGMPMIPSHIVQPRPIFPAAMAATTSVAAHHVHATSQQKPTFPAYR